MIDWIKNFLKTLWSLPVILSAIGVAGVLLVASFLILSFIQIPIIPEPTAVLLIISGPTSTPYFVTPVPSIMPSPTSNLRPSPLPGMIGVGSYVQIFGTAGTGLNIREEAGLASDVNFLAYDAEAFEVRGGPVENDGITWWYLVTPVDENRSGWAAANYLSVIPTP